MPYTSSACTHAYTLLQVAGLTANYAFEVFDSAELVRSTEASHSPSGRMRTRHVDFIGQEARCAEHDRCFRNCCGFMQVLLYISV
jgi:hypothetical protein